MLVLMPLLVLLHFGNDVVIIDVSSGAGVGGVSVYDGVVVDIIVVIMRIVVVVCIYVVTSVAGVDIVYVDGGNVSYINEH